MTLNKVYGISVIKNLYIQNYPIHCFSISICANLTIENIILNNEAGNGLELVISKQAKLRGLSLLAWLVWVKSSGLLACLAA